MKSLTFIWLALFFLSSAFAQLPSTNVYLMDMTKISDSTFRFEKVKLVSGDNLEGYNNQPSFFYDQLYMTCQPREADQTDIFAFDPNYRLKWKVTETLEAEYSPSLMGDGKHFSVVRVGMDGETQQIWKYRLDQIGLGEVVLPEETKVGYHLWVDDIQVVFFEVGKPHLLKIGNILTGRSKELIPDIGRCFQIISDRVFSFVRIIDGEKHIQTYNLNTGEVKEIIKLPGKSQDFERRENGTFITASGSLLFKFNPSIDEDWVQVADFTEIGLNNITRLALHENGQLALVNENK